MTISSIGRRVALVGSLAMLVALLPLAASAQDPTGPVIIDLQVNDEVDASDSVQTSVLWSQQAFADDSADEVLIATDQDFADALASGVLQGDAPLLYTDGDTVDDLVLAEIDRVGATSATILGGEVAVSPDVEEALTDAGLEVSRLWGESRIETAVAIAEQELEGDAVFLARAFADTDPTQAFADALALGGWAADSGIPVLLTQTDVLTGNTRAFLEANTDITNVTVIGGDAAISEDVVGELEELGLTVERIGGETRWGTAVEIAEARGLEAAAVEQVVFVEGQSETAYINGFAAAAYSAANDAPILLVNGENVPQETQDYLGDEADFSITDADGETAAVLGTEVSDEAAQTLADALNATLVPTQLAGPIEGNQTFEVSPAEAATLTVNEERQYTVADATGCEVDLTIALFPAANVTVDENGVVTFVDANDNDTADDIGNTTAVIAVVNGSAQPANTRVTTAAPVGSTLNFTITSAGPDSVVPVVFCDADSDGQLDLQDVDEGEEGTDNAPVAEEIFGVGGATTFIPEEAPDGMPVAGVVVDVDPDGAYAVVGVNTVFFRDGDVYRIISGGFALRVSSEEFFQNLTVNDVLQTCADQDVILPATYDQDGPNVFCLDDVAPVSPANLVAAAGNPPDSVVDLTWNAVAGVDSYNVYVNDEACASTTVTELGLVDNVEAAAAPEYSATGLAPSGTYCFVVTSVDGSDESTLAVGSAAGADDNTVEIGTLPPVEAPEITSAVLTTDAPIEGLADTGDVWTLTFNEDINGATVVGAQINVTDADGDTARIQCGLAVAPNDFLTSANCTLDGTLRILTIDLLEAAEDRNAAGDDTIQNPVTITSITGLTDVDDGVSPDIAASDDVVID